jgi:hypothetical protein
VAADVARNSDTCHPADPRTDFLDPRHQRIAEQHRPQHRESELRANLRVGRDAAGIVVGSAGYDARTQLLKAAKQF